MKIVAYTYEADIHCVKCAVERFARLEPTHSLQPASYGFTETLSDGSTIDLDENRIDIEQMDNEGNKITPVFAIDEILREHKHCGDCHEPLE